MIQFEKKTKSCWGLLVIRSNCSPRGTWQASGRHRLGRNINEPLMDAEHACIFRRRPRLSKIYWSISCGFGLVITLVWTPTGENLSRDEVWGDRFECTPQTPHELSSKQQERLFLILGLLRSPMNLSHRAVVVGFRIVLMRFNPFQDQLAHRFFVIFHSEDPTSHFRSSPDMSLNQYVQ